MLIIKAFDKRYGRTEYRFQIGRKESGEYKCILEIREICKFAISQVLAFYLLNHENDEALDLLKREIRKIEREYWNSILDTAAKRSKAIATEQNKSPEQCRKTCS